MKDISIVLSGGGVRGVAHLGILQRIDEMGIKISTISGTSAGAMIGAFYADGYKPLKILEIIHESKIFKLTNIHLSNGGLFDMNPLEMLFQKYFPHNRIEELKTSLIINATDIINGEITYFKEGNLSKCLIASSCVPLVFQPVEYENLLYLDGGIMNNFPIEPVLDAHEYIIGVNVNSLSQNIKQIHFKDMLDRSFQLALSKEMKAKSKLCSVFLEPPEMSRFGMFDFNSIDEIYNFSYKYALTNEKIIKHALNL